MVVLDFSVKDDLNDGSRVDVCKASRIVGAVMRFVCVELGMLGVGS